MRSCNNLCVVLSVIGIVGFAVQANADFTRRDSSAFTYQYEMNKLPGGEDLDGNLSADFADYGTGTASVAGGILTLATDTADRGFLGGDSSSQIMANSGISVSSGYTIETRVKVVTSSGSQGAFAINLAPTSGSVIQTLLCVDAGSQAWSNDVTDIGVNDNTDNFHVFRVAQAPGEANFTVWRDGVRLATGLPTGGPWAGRSFNFGDFSSSYAGTTQVDYVPVHGWRLCTSTRTQCHAACCNRHHRLAGLCLA